MRTGIRWRGRRTGDGDPSTHTGGVYVRPGGEPRNAGRTGGPTNPRSRFPCSRRGAGSNDWTRAETGRQFRTIHVSDPETPGPPLKTRTQRDTSSPPEKGSASNPTGRVTRSGTRDTSLGGTGTFTVGPNGTRSVGGWTTSRRRRTVSATGTSLPIPTPDPGCPDPRPPN